MPGLGHIRSLMLLYDIHDLERVPRKQACASSGRRITGAPASAGNRVNTSGKNIGNTHRPWAFSEAAVVCLQHKPHGQKDLIRLEQKHATGTALTILAHTLARAVSDMRKRTTAFDLALFLG